MWVPQGTFLGPLLFKLYINDIVNVSTIFKLMMFADDNNVFASKKIADQLTSIENTELFKVVNWLKINKSLKKSINPLVRALVSSAD